MEKSNVELLLHKDSSRSKMQSFCTWILFIILCSSV
jgi:hypothetical protein